MLTDKEMPAAAGNCNGLGKAATCAENENDTHAIRMGQSQSPQSTSSPTGGDALDVLCAGLTDYAEANVRDAFAKRPDYFRVDAKGRLRIRVKLDGRLTAERKALHNAITRTTCAKHSGFAHYSAAGRYVHDIFRKGDGVRSGYERWFAEIGLKPAKDYDVDRIDNDGPYSIGNLRWIDKAGSHRNQSNVKLSSTKVAAIKAIGYELSKRVIADYYGIDRSVVTRIRSGRAWSEIAAAPRLPVWAVQDIAERKAQGLDRTPRRAKAPAQPVQLEVRP